MLGAYIPFRMPQAIAGCRIRSEGDYFRLLRSPGSISGEPVASRCSLIRTTQGLWDMRSTPLKAKQIADAGFRFTGEACRPTQPSQIRLSV